MKVFKFLFPALLISFASVAQDTDSVDAKINSAIAQLAKSLVDKNGKVAVMDFPSVEGKVTGFSTYISNRTVNQLINANRDVVDRMALEKVISEQRMQQSALMDSKTAAKVGKLAGAKFLVLGSYDRLPKAMNITMRILSVETAQFIAAQEFPVPLNGDNSLLINDLVAKKGQEAPTASLEAAPAPTSKVLQDVKKTAVPTEPAVDSD